MSIGATNTFFDKRQWCLNVNVRIAILNPTSSFRRPSSLRTDLGNFLWHEVEATVQAMFFVADVSNSSDILK